MATYKNPWHRKDNSIYGPAEYTTDVKPTNYRGYLIYERIKGSVWDVVIGGQCVTQRAGLGGAKRFVDEQFGKTKRKVAG